MTVSAVAPRLFSFVAGSAGTWTVDHTRPVVGESLPVAACLSVVAAGSAEESADTPTALWRLRGIVSNERYVERVEKDALVARQEGLGRPACTRAALIPIRKNAAWWALTQDDRRDVFEAQSQHIAIGMRYLPAIARRLHHCRDLGPAEPFDFLTWFEYTPADAGAFEDLVGQLRASPEWRFIEREVDIRLAR
ncbi:MAG: chlorite dismutase family protein [Vicinamibacteraceae bacterium]